MAMLLRPAEPADIPAIIDLLRDSLGESTIPKSVSLWKWKHERNPFGPSYVLVAEEDGVLTGVRAFMKWEWRWRGRMLRAIRAVDTATHPDHQGKGIFKKLTLRQIELCREQGVDFIFNTPNEQSRPGYLKMGWVELGRMPLKLRLQSPLSLAWAKLSGSHRHSPAPDQGHEDPTPFQEWAPIVNALPDIYPRKTEHLVTALSAAYISWRYINNPLFRYNYFTDDENFLLISRIKQHSFGKELRLVDFVIFRPDADIRSLRSFIRKAVIRFCREHHIGIVSFSGPQYRQYAGCFSWMGLLPVRGAGPVVTLRDLNLNEKFVSLLDIRNWCYSTGDMELF